MDHPRKTGNDVDNNIDLKQQTKILVRLQAIDSDKKRIRTMLSRVDEKVKNLDGELDLSREVVRNGEQEMDGLRKKYRELEAELSLNTPRIEKSKAKLRAVKTNKEYQSLLKEIDELEKVSATMEDGILECLERIEGSERTLDRLEADHRIVAERIEDEKKEVSRESQDGVRRLKELEAEWNKVAREIVPEVMKTFERVRNQSRGVAIARVVDAVCQACNMNIPPQLFNELRRFDALKFCPNCQRLIYWEETT